MGGELFRHLFEKIMSFDFLALKITFHLVAQLEIFIKSLFNCAAVSAGSVPDAKSEVSSAKISMSLSMSETMSFIYIINSKGPSLEP